MMKDLTDEELWKLVRDNADPGAFGIIYDRHARFLKAIAASKLQNWESAQDIVQEVFLQVYANRKKLEINKLRPYLTGFTANKAIDYVRRAAKYDNVAEINEKITPKTIEHHLTPDQILEAKNLAAAIENQIAKLPPRCKLVFTYRQETDMRMVDIAKALNVSKKTVEMQMSDAIKRLLKVVDRAAFSFL